VTRAEINGLHEEVCPLSGDPLVLVLFAYPITAFVVGADWDCKQQRLALVGISLGT
jgi:hypothetical protein